MMEETEYCDKNIPDCKLYENASLSDLHLGPVPCYVGIISNTVSCMGSVLIILIYIAWKDLRDNGAQSIITFIAISDFFTAFGFMIGSINPLAYPYNNHLIKPDWGRCNIYVTMCEIESFIVTCATMSSYFWTIILSFYFYFKISHNYSMTKRLMPLYHIIAWGGPLLIAFPLLCIGKLAYAPFVSGIWCYMEIYHGKPPFSKSDNIISALVEIPEIVSFILILVVFIFTCWKFHKITRNRSLVVGLNIQDRTANIQEKVKSAKKTLIFIPVLFILLRVWTTIQYFYTFYLTNTALVVKNGYCIPSHLKRGRFVLGIFQAIGGGGQGWANCVLYVFMSPALRNRLFKSCKILYYKILYHCTKAAHANEEVTTSFMQVHESGATDTVAKNLEKEWM